MRAGQVLRLVRTTAGRTLADIARRSQMTAGHLSRLERGEREMDQFALLRLQQALADALAEGPVPEHLRRGRHMA